VTDLAAFGIIQFTNKKPHCVSPLTVSLKRGIYGSIKKILCWDGSRCQLVSTKTNSHTVTLPKGVGIDKTKNFQVTYDLKQPTTTLNYHHQLHNETVQTN
jgi:hypothetical protein